MVGSLSEPRCADAPPAQPHLVSMTLMTARHRKCYANRLGGCSTKISGEHPFSHAILDAMGGSFDVVGLPFIPVAGSKRLSTKALQANILCTNHNSALSSFDGEALAFFLGLQAISRNLTLNVDDASTNLTTFNIDGEKLERWLTKILCGMLAGWSRTDFVLPDMWLHHVFKKASLAVGSGFYLATNSGSFKPGEEPLIIAVMTRPDGASRVPFGLRLNLNGFQILLSLAGVITSDSPPVNFAYRPGALMVHDTAGQKWNRIVFKWPTGTAGRPLYASAGS